MPEITKITKNKTNPRRLVVHLDGRLGFACFANIAARFELEVGVELNRDQISAIQEAQRQQECLDHALRLLARRPHSKMQIKAKLVLREYQPNVIAQCLRDLERLGYLNDAELARIQASSAAERKQGRNKVLRDLLNAGVEAGTARQEVDRVFHETNSLASALEIALKKAPVLKKLAPQVARQRLAGMLLRRGFDEDTIRPVLNEVLGDEPDQPIAD
jgi:regulatory protein